jgi:uncharacterized protein involved in exopolysaccharide biosynthesis
MQNRITLKSTREDSEDGNLASVSLIDLGRLLLKSRTVLTVSTLAVMAIVAVILFLIPNQYQSTASVLPSGNMDKFSALKELTGMGGIPSLGDDNSSVLFPDILKSNQIRDGVLDKEYSFTHKATPMTLTLKEYFGDDNPDRLRKALDEIITVYMDKKTGVIRMAAETEYPEFSQAILNQVLAELEDFNLYKRRSQAGNSEVYLARELATRETELTTAEDELEQFQSVNRDWNGSDDPGLMKTVSRMRRDLEVKSRTYGYVQEQYQIARMEAQRDVPVVSTLDPPSLPTVKSGPPRLTIIAVSGVLTFLVMFFLMVAIDSLRKGRRNLESPAYRALHDDFNTAFPRLSRLVSTRERSTEVSSA